MPSPGTRAGRSWGCDEGCTWPPALVSPVAAIAKDVSPESICVEKEKLGRPRGVSPQHVFRIGEWLGCVNGQMSGWL